MGWKNVLIADSFIKWIEIFDSYEVFGIIKQKEEIMVNMDNYYLAFFQSSITVDNCRF